VTIEKNRRLIGLLAASHVGTWLFVLVTSASPFEPRIVLGLAAAAVVGTVVGVSVRSWQVGRWSRLPLAE
ncbi:MAG: hypothetical protein N2B05_03320, partial [Gemmatimonadales bacterium]